VSLSERLPNSPFFLRPENITTGRHPGGLAIAINRTFAASLLHSSDIYIAVGLECFKLSCIYVPTNYRTDTSDKKFISACASLSKILHRLQATNRWLVTCGNFNTNLNDPSLPLTQMFLSSVPLCISVLPKYKLFFVCS